MTDNKKKGKSKKTSAEHQAPLWRIKLLWGCVALVSLLGLLSLLSSGASLDQDIKTLFGDNSSIGMIFTSAVNDLENPIGVFGVLVSYALIGLFGKVFSVLSLLILLAVSLHGFIYPEKLEVRFRGFLLIVIMFCLQVVLISKDQFHTFTNGWLPWGAWYLLRSLFSQVGGLIVVIGAAILGVVLILGFETIKQKLLEWGEKYLRWKEVRKMETPAGQPFVLQNPDGPSITDHVQLRAEEEKKKAVPEPVKPALPEEKQPLAIPPKLREQHVFPQPSDDEAEDEREYMLPSISDFLESPVKLSRKDREEIENQIKATSKILMEKLAEFGIEAEVINVNIGPIITQYELRPAPGVKVSKFTSLADDLALAIKAKSIRVQAPIPGKGLIGIEIPNLARDTIYLRDILLSDEMEAAEPKLSFGLGKEISGKPVVTDLARMPHLLIAGATGSGKSVCINTIIMSLLLRTKPDELRLVLIDPKRVELAGYNDLPHLIGSVVTDSETALETMYWGVREMERRYELLQEAKVRDIIAFNEKAAESEDFQKLPYIIIIIDEFADLIMTSGKDIELPITRLAQMARAVGIHLILATQRPSIKVITGIIKANFPARIAFQVSSKVDSRVILDMIGAERLLGQGDMLFMPPGKAQAERIHGAFVSDHEIERVCAYLRLQPKPKDEITIVSPDKTEMDFLEYDDELFPEAARVVVSANLASVSMLQRHFKIGYARAGRLIDMLERAHIVGPHLGSKSRDVLATMKDLEVYGIRNED
jgi:DNA segregation ATPase FtsK/SpoIIIE, S-DNA-T family